MRVKIIAIILCLTLISFPLGCASVMEDHSGAAVGAGAGGAVGGVMGAIIGHGTGAVVVGALAGALLGGAIGHFGYDQEKTREQTAKNYSYKESQGHGPQDRERQGDTCHRAPRRDGGSQNDLCGSARFPEHEARVDRNQGDHF